MVNVKGRYKAHGSEQQELCIFKKQKKQNGEPGRRTPMAMYIRNWTVQIWYRTVQFK